MFIADFHIHSSYSRATSKECVPEMLDLWARRKGLDLIGTGDFTHQAWREELKEKLVPAENGLYVLKNDFRREDKIGGAVSQPHFIISGEISSIYKKNGKVRKVHNLILLPGLAEAEFISRRLEEIGNLHSDGRPILGLDSKDLLEIVLERCPEAIFIPAHIWTPHFSLFGAYSGFDDITECFEDLTDYIYALETGLSSDPPMNWRLSALDRFSLISNSDAHSPANLAREANLFNTDLAYPSILRALKNRSTREFYGTLEFFPEEGKYHYDGHRDCKVCLKPTETLAAAGVCPVCGGRITVGVLHRVEALADRPEGFTPPDAKHFESLVPLPEIVAASLGLGVASVKVKGKYNDLIGKLGPELFILREAALSDIELAAGPCVAEGVRRLRSGKVDIHPGYDGEYGKIKLLDQAEIDRISGQLRLFGEVKPAASGNGKDKTKGKSDKEIPQAQTPAPAPEKPLPSVSPSPLNLDQDLHHHTGPTELSSSGAFSSDAFSSGTLYGLNQEQWEAVSCAEPVIAVMAGPGTGKTKTLVSRIAYLVEHCGVHPAQITAVTFTNKAAREMRTRLEKQFGGKERAKTITIGTFHSIGLDLLSGGETHKPSIIDQYNALSILEDLIKESGIKLSPRDALRDISLQKNGGFLPENGEKKSEVPGPIYDAYCAQLERFGMMDFDDILLNVLHTFADRPEDHTAENNAFTHLLVDEFQDINEIQYRLIKAWGSKSESIFIIGDPDQSIYGFRGSDFRYFAKFKDDFPALRQIRLTQNYRSTPEILTSAQSVLSRRQGGSPSIGESPSLVAKKEKGGKVRLVEAHEPFSEALFIAKEINRMVGGIDMLDAHRRSPKKSSRTEHAHPLSFSDIAILYRTNHQAEILEQCLLREGIQYVVAGRDEFLSDRQVRAALAFFRFLLNPEDASSLRLCLRAESTYSPEQTQSMIQRYMSAAKSVSSLVRILAEIERSPLIPDKSQSFLQLLKRYETMIRKEKPGKVVESWIKDNNLADLKSMEMLLNTAVLHDKMSSFVQNLVLGRESDVVRSGSKLYSSDAVSLMTMHGSKGLEFPVVFLCGVNEGVIPLRNSSHPSNWDEERRLFYVGMTRAQDELILLTSPDPSPFLADIPREHLAMENTMMDRAIPQFKQISLFDRG